MIPDKKNFHRGRRESDFFPQQIVPRPGADVVAGEQRGAAGSVGLASNYRRTGGGNREFAVPRKARADERADGVKVRQ